ncbi:hypothetical protein BG011_006736 [Mortierella polycephala]|uniref:GATA-type domain-containing protein n=1 Tax=Mortierella polycephala TaxID=41804 RepID=A0A9P6TZJ2_9FUNG|nr:hypothetical protein BG011_006736 [Mortierella polycephala]
MKLHDEPVSQTCQHQSPPSPPVPHHHPFDFDLGDKADPICEIQLDSNDNCNNNDSNHKMSRHDSKIPTIDDGALSMASGADLNHKSSGASSVLPEDHAPFPARVVSPGICPKDETTDVRAVLPSPASIPILDEVRKAYNLPPQNISTAFFQSQDTMRCAAYNAVSGPTPGQVNSEHPSARGLVVSSSGASSFGAWVSQVDPAQAATLASWSMPTVSLPHSAQWACQQTYDRQSMYPMDVSGNSTRLHSQTMQNGCANLDSLSNVWTPNTGYYSPAAYTSTMVVPDATSSTSLTGMSATRSHYGYSRRRSAMNTSPLALSNQAALAHNGFNGANGSQKLHGKPRPFFRTKDGSIKIHRTLPEHSPCAICGTTETPIWRKGPNNSSICNGCSLIAKQTRGTLEGHGGADSSTRLRATSNGSSSSLSSASRSLSQRPRLRSRAKNSGADIGSYKGASVEGSRKKKGATSSANHATNGSSFYSTEAINGSTGYEDGTGGKYPLEEWYQHQNQQSQHNGHQYSHYPYTQLSSDMLDASSHANSYSSVPSAGADQFWGPSPQQHYYSQAPHHQSYQQYSCQMYQQPYTHQDTGPTPSSNVHINSNSYSTSECHTMSSSSMLSGTRILAVPSVETSFSASAPSSSPAELKLTMPSSCIRKSDHRFQEPKLTPASSAVSTKSVGSPSALSSSSLSSHVQQTQGLSPSSEGPSNAGEKATEDRRSMSTGSDLSSGEESDSGLDD